MRPLHNLQERWNHLVRTFRQDSLTLAGLAHARLRYFATELNSPPTIIEPDDDRERLLEQVLQDFASPKWVVQSLAAGECLELLEKGCAAEVPNRLKAAFDRLHWELIRRLELALEFAPWWQRVIRTAARHPDVTAMRRH